MEAEARSLNSLFGYMPKFKAIDLYLEYRCLLNHNHKYSYGQQYIDGKVIKTTPPPNKWEAQDVSIEELESEGHHKPSFSLAAATFKLLNIKIDTVEKNEVRDIIIASDPKAIEENALRILKYNASDIDYLPQLMDAVFDIHKSFGETLEGWAKAALLRGDYAVRTARMLSLGYPVNMGKINKFTSNVKGILNEAIEDCLENSSEVESFRFNKKQGKYILTEANIREWIQVQAKPYWRKTAKDKLSVSRDAFKDWYGSESPGFAGAFCRYLKTKQSLNGFLPSETSKKNTFKDFVGSDNRVRPYFGIYGSQSSRSQPGATGFIPLKSHWMRNFIEAPKGRAIAGVDYASQEFLIAAILSQDREMMKAYESGDVYLAFAKAAALVPQDATKSSHKQMRDVCKALVLGISYDMSANGLAPRLTQSLGKPVTVDYAQQLIDTFYEVYSDYADWKKDVAQDYEQNSFIQLSDGWTMWGDNDNHRSVGNFPVQGHGAVIMRKAVELAQSKGLNIIYTLHDALYMEFDSYDTAAISMLKDAMSTAFNIVMSEFGDTIPIRLEGEAWSVDYANKLPGAVNGIQFMPEYIDAKGQKELDRFKKYFDGEKVLPQVELDVTKLPQQVSQLTKVIKKGVPNGVHNNLN